MTGASSSDKVTRSRSRKGSLRSQVAAEAQAAQRGGAPLKMHSGTPHTSLKVQDCSREPREEDPAKPAFKILRYRSLDRCQRAVPTSKESVQDISILNPLIVSRIGTLSPYLSPPWCSRQRHRNLRLIMLHNVMSTGRRLAEGTVTQHCH